MKALFKKSLAVLLSAMLLFTAAPFAASAAVALQEQSVGASSGTTGDCTWTLDDEGTLIISGNGAMGDYDDEYYGGNYIATAPWGANIKTVVIEDGVTSIGDDAFSGCTGLTSITIPDSVTSIGYGAFSGCTGLISVTIPDSVTSIGEYAFSGCTGLTSVTVESGNSVYDSRNNCNAIIKTATNELICGCKTTVIPNSATSIGDGAFYDCTGLTSVTIPDSVTRIGDDAFYDTAWYNNQPDGLVYAGKVAYKYKGTMPNNTSITIQDGTKVITDYAFSGCTGLTSVHITDIAAWCNIAFSSNYSNPLSNAHNLYLNGVPVTNLVIPNSVTSIGYYAFYGCTGLTSVTIPDSVTSIGDNAFSNCHVNLIS